jgi:hypothetical protein
MAITIPATITGAAQTGLTSPTYTTSTDSADFNQKQVAISALGGTQTGVTTHSMSSPFTVMVQKPKTFQVLGKPNPTTGLIANVGRNIFKIVVRKGVTPLVNQPIQIAIARGEIEIPAGADSYDAPNIRAMLSAYIGVLSGISAGLGDTAVSGVL